MKECQLVIFLSFPHCTFFYSCMQVCVLSSALDIRFSLLLLLGLSLRPLALPKKTSPSLSWESSSLCVFYCISFVITYEDIVKKIVGERQNVDV